MVDIGPKVTWAKFGPIWSKNEIALSPESSELLTVFCGAICRSEVIYVRRTQKSAPKLAQFLRTPSSVRRSERQMAEQRAVRVTNFA